ncbi:MAG: prephenate dehydrogenase/arogenate dehydrogenase family protein [Thioalkalivibrio sp.]|nr:prephenate dehydrogenase/arogenate dehydrogenase family protein [Thioalkalivibrio sp.]
MIGRLVIFGVGLIGGSMALALRAAGAVSEVVGCSRSEANLAEAQRLGVIDRWTTDPAQACAEADLGVLAVPLGSMQGLSAAIAEHWPAEAVLTDVGSSKQAVLDAVRAGFGRLPRNFVAGHPIAGTERSGVGAAFPGLFQDRLVILTPADETSPLAAERVADMWRATGARIEFMTPAHHDHVLAATSHLPHVLAFALVESLARMSESDEVFHYAAGGFRDFTRIASSDPVVWRDICLANRDAILEMLERFQGDLDSLRQVIARGDGTELEARFDFAKNARDRFSEKMQAQLDQ